jgi:hypothetical protein
MRMCWLLILAGLMTSSSVFAGLVQYSTTPASSGGSNAFGGTLYRYTYLISGFNFQADQELDIRFDAGQFSHITLVSSTQPGFNTLLLQPNNPLGATGSFSALATQNNAPNATFVLDAYYTGTGDPGSQLYFVNQYSATGAFQGTLSTGNTVSATPEPSTFLTGGFLLVAGGMLRRARRK